ncbi:Lymphoid-restricted membrane protein-like [Homarus americanus]|uniref:Lymphoid-restricted membrane protein-like n=1 Tax=Homarus americanus TaxID=6706 RepID=A0A8J5NBV0_HOMAM|nr:Lymphoid-restricted membrane protein-like [Homarus americanus]
MEKTLPIPEHITSFYDLVKAVKNSNENLSAQEIEVNRLTLRQRLDVQQRQRDTAETNFDTEIDQLRSSVLSPLMFVVQSPFDVCVTESLDVCVTESLDVCALQESLMFALHADCLDTELIDAVTQVRRHLDILATSSTRLVYASEVWGAVQQEWRVSRALEVLLLHVENVKRIGALSQSSSDYTAASRRVRALSLAGCTNKSQDNRRISLSSGLTKSQPNSYLTSSRGSRRRASLMPDLKPFQEKFAALAATAAAAAAAAAATTTAPAAASSSSTNSSTTSTSKDNTEENGQPPTGVYSSITEEGSESGEEGQDSPSSTTNKNPSINSSIINSLAQLHPDLYAVEPSLQNGDRSWLMVALEGVIGWARGGQWPYSPQQTVQGARYAFTSLLLLLAAFFLLLTISSGDSSVLQPYHPGWTTIHHVLHPFVTVRFLGPPPT